MNVLNLNQNEGEILYVICYCFASDKITKGVWLPNILCSQFKCQFGKIHQNKVFFLRGVIHQN